MFTNTELIIFVVSVIGQFILNYFTSVRRIDALQKDLEHYKEKILEIESTKIDSRISKLELQLEIELSQIKHTLEEIKAEIKKR